MLNTLKIYVQHVLVDKKCGFGVDIDQGERVFIPPNLVKKYRLAEGTLAQMRVIPNTSRMINSTKYQVVGSSKPVVSCWHWFSKISSIPSV